MTKNEFRQLLNKNTIKIDGLRLKIIELQNLLIDLNEYFDKEVIKF